MLDEYLRFGGSLRRIKNPMVKAFVDRGKDLGKKRVEYFAARVKRWKLLKDLERPSIPLLLCRLCEQNVSADLMLVTQISTIIHRSTQSSVWRSQTGRSSSRR